MNTAAFIVLASTLVMLLVWAGGLVPVSVCLAAALTCGLSAVFALRRRSNPEPEPLALPVPRLELLAAIAMGLMILSALPLPPALEPVTGTARQLQNDAVRQALRDCIDAGLPGDPAPWFSLTRNRAGTWRMLLLLAAAFGAASLASRLPRAARWAWLTVLVGIGMAAGIAGHISQWWIPQGDRLWWWFPIPHVLPGPVGCFVNRNHFGGFLALLIPVAMGLAAAAWTSRQRLGAIAAALAALVMALALLLSLSRGALLALASGVGITILIAAVRRRARTALILLTAAALMAVGALFFPHPAVRDRLTSLRQPLQDPSVINRISQWRETLRVWPHYPAIGAGPNALRMVYPQHRRTSSGRWLVHAENMPVEWLADGGLVGATVLLAGAVLLLRRLRTGCLLLPSACRPGLAGALLVAALHALWDFPVLVPVYAVTLATLIGTLLPPPEPLSGVPRLLRLAPALAGLIAAVALAPAGFGALRRLDSHEALRTAPIDELQRALVWAPTSWHAWYYLGVSAARHGVDRQNLRACILGERLVGKAASLDPHNYRLWFKLGEMRLALMDFDGAETAFARAKALRPWLSPPRLDRPGVAR